MEFNFQDLLNGLNIGLIVVFSILMAGLLIAAIVGYKRGVFKSTYRLIAMAVLILISILTLDTISNLVNDFNLLSITEPLGYTHIIVTNPDTEASIAVEITTLFETVRSVCDAFYVLFNAGGSSYQTFVVVTGLATTIVKYFTFIGMMFFNITIGNLLITIFWYLIFNKFVPKIAIKKVRLRLLSILETMVTYIVVAFMIIAPFSSITNSAIGEYRKRAKTYDEQEISVNINSALDVYENSLFNKTFGWTVGDTGLSLDSLLMKRVTKTTVGNAQTSIIDSITALSGLGAEYANIYFENNGDIHIGNLLMGDLKSLVNNVFTIMSNSAIITQILPIAISIAIESDVIETDFDLKQLGVGDANFAYELDNARLITLDILDTGILNEILDPNEDTLIKENPDVKAIFLKLFRDETAKDAITSALSRIDNSVLMSNLIPTLVKYLVSLNEDMGTIIDATWDELHDIKWGFEMSALYDILYELDHVDNTLLDNLFSLLEEQDPQNISREGGESSNELPISDILSLFGDHIDDIIKAFVGKTVERNDALELDETKLDPVTGRNNDVNNKYSLFDLEISKFVFNGLTSALVAGLEESLSEEEISNIKDQLAALKTASWRRNYKNEISSIFYTAASLKGHEELLTTLMGEEFDLMNNMGQANELVSLLQTALPRMDNSVILANTVFPIIENAISSEEVRQNFEMLGDHFDFELISQGFMEARHASPKGGEYRGHELSKIVGVLPSILALSEAMSDTSLTTNEMLIKIGELSPEINNILDTFYISRILNPKEAINKNANYFGLFDFLFEQAGGASVGLVLDLSSSFFPNEANRTDAYWLNQNAKLVNVIKTISETGILNIIESEDILTDLTGDDATTRNKLRTLLLAVSESDVFSSTMGKFLDKAINNDILIDMTNTSFEYVSDWAKEAENLYKLLESANSLTSLLNDGFEFSSMKDVVSLNNLLHRLANSSIFDAPTGYSFSNWLYARLIDGLSIEGSSVNLFDNPSEEEWNKYASYWGSNYDANDKNSVVRYDFSILDNRDSWVSPTFNFLTKEELINKYGSSTEYYKNSSFYDSYFSNEQDEITNFVEIIYYMNDVLGGIDNIFSLTDEDVIGGSISSAIKGLLDSVNKTSTMRIVLYNIYNLVKEQISTDSSLSGFIDLKNVNSAYLLSGYDPLFTERSIVSSREYRKQELPYLGELVDGIFALLSADLMDEQGNLLFSNMDASTVDSISKIFIALEQSQVFHRYAQNSSEKWHPTVFQSLLFNVLTTDAFSELIYNQYSPKDNSELYENKYKEYGTPSAESKSKYLINTVFPALSEDYSSEETEIANFIEIIYSLVGNENHIGIKDKEGNITVSFSDIDFLNQDNIDAIKDIIKGFNNSKIFKDALSNAMWIIFDDNNAVLNDFSGVDFSYANPYYIYDNGNYDATYSDEEINYICDIFTEVLSLKDGFDFSSISSIDDAFLNSASKILKYASKTKILNSIPKGKDPNALTVFEQIISKAISETTITDFLYDPSYELDLAYGSATKKLNAIIKNISLENNSGTKYGFTKTWEEEIDATFETIKAFKEIYNGSSVNLANINPTTIINTLYTANGSDLLNDTVDYLIKVGFSQTNISDLATYKNVNYAYYHLDQFAFGDEDNKGGEIALLKDLLEVLYDEESHTYKTTDPTSLTDSLKNNEASKTFMKFLFESRVFNTFEGVYNQKFNLSNNDKASARGLFMYNILDKIPYGDDNLSTLVLNAASSKAIRGENAYTPSIENRISRLSYLFDISNSDSEIEANGLTSLLLAKDNINLQALTSENIEAIKNQVDGIRPLLESCYKNGRSYFASEIIGGVLISQLETEYKLLDNEYEYEPILFAPYVIDDISTNGYDNINQKENDGLYGSLKALVILEDMSKHFSPLDNEKIPYEKGQELINAFIHMGNSGNGNSKVANIYYLSRIVELVKPLQMMGYTNFRDDVNSITFPTYASMGNDIVSFLTQKGYILEA